MQIQIQIHLLRVEVVHPRNAKQMHDKILINLRVLRTNQHIHIHFQKHIHPPTYTHSRLIRERLKWMKEAEQIKLCICMCVRVWVHIHFVFYALYSNSKTNQHTHTHKHTDTQTHRHTTLNWQNVIEKT